MRSTVHLISFKDLFLSLDELRTLAECMRECNWLPKLMRETHDGPAVRSNEYALPASEDNRIVIKWVENPCAHS